MMSHLKLSFLGNFQTSLDEKPIIHYRSAKTQGLLIFLALNPNERHARQHLASLFWPEEPDDVAKRNLRQSLYRLRQAFADSDEHAQPFFLSDRTTIQLNPASDYLLDVHSFLAHLQSGQLEKAVEILRGELLPGFTCDSLPFDDWLRTERERLHRLGLNALYQQTEQYLAEGSYAEAQRLARKQLEFEAWREEAHRQLIQALALQGERSASLAQYDQCRQILQAELGIEPSTETKGLIKRIRDQILESRGEHQGGDPAESPKLSIPFVGRQSEFRILVSAYEETVREGFQTVVLKGKAGIGKSRLAQQFLNWATTQGADILRSRVYETGSGLSYQPLIQLWRQRLERENAPEDLLSDLWLSQLTRILPELRERYPDLPQPIQEEALARHHLFEAQTRLGQALANRHPLILFIDDWHWADNASLELLDYATRHWQESGSPILVLLTFRLEVLNESPEIQSWLARFGRDIKPKEMSLNELSQGDTEQMIKMLLGANLPNPDTADATLSRFNRWLFAETEGQPLFLTETLKSLLEEGIVVTDRTQTGWHIDWAQLDEFEAQRGVLPGIQTIIRSWLGRISPAAKHLLTSASILAQEASFKHLCYVAALDEMTALDGLDELLGKQLLIEEESIKSSLTTGSRYDFSHQKVSDIVYHEAGKARQRILHRRAFESLKQGNAPAAELAQHALRAGLIDETISTSLIAGSEALGLFAYQIAVDHFERARELAKLSDQQKSGPSQDDLTSLYLGLGRAYEMRVAWPKARDTYEALIAYAREIEATRLEWQGLNLLASVFNIGLNDRQQAISLLNKAKSVAEQHKDIRGIAETESNLAYIYVASQQDKIGLEYAEHALQLARQLEAPEIMARCLNALAMGSGALRRWMDGKAYAEEALQLLKASGNLEKATYSQAGLGYSHLFIGEPQKGIVLVREALDFCRKIEHFWIEAEACYMLSLLENDVGNWGESISLSRQAVEKSQRMGFPALSVLTKLDWGSIQLNLLALDGARETCTQAYAEATAMSDVGWFSDWARSALCKLHAMAQEWDQACQYAKELVPSNKALLPPFITFWHETAALLHGGEDDLARSEVERIAGLVEDNQRYQLPLHRSQAVLAQWDGEVDQAIAYLESALTLAQEIGLPGEEWPILSELGGLYREQGHHKKGEASDQAAADLIHRLAETIDDHQLKKGFLSAAPIQSILSR